MEISDDDINHLHSTVTSVLSILKLMSPQTDKIDSFEKLKDLISVDTLKTMQLLGFNYKAAIGEPLLNFVPMQSVALVKKERIKGINNDKIFICVVTI